MLLGSLFFLNSVLPLYSTDHNVMLCNNHVDFKIFTVTFKSLHDLFPSPPLLDYILQLYELF